MKAPMSTEKTITSPTLVVPRPRSEWLGITRQVVQFILTPRVLWIFLVIPLGMVLYKIAIHFETPLAVILRDHLPLLALSVLATLGLVFGARLRTRVDQLFFSQQRQQEELLVSLLDQIANFNEVSEVIYHTCRVLNEAYQATPIHFFFRVRETRALKLAYSYGAATEILWLSEDSQLRPLLKREEGVLEYPLHPGLELPPSEQAWLEQLQARMLVPLRGKDHRLRGLITLGQNQRGAGYSPNDQLLLAAIGEQIIQRLEQEEKRHQINEQAKVPLATLARLEADLKKQLATTQTDVAQPLHHSEEGNPKANKIPLWI